MALTKYKFGELIELTNQKNTDNKYGKDDAIGVNICLLYTSDAADE